MNLHENSELFKDAIAATSQTRNDGFFTGNYT